ncbi:MAG: hypothetical protein KC613_18955 [Myxococcales bacterium]|nr:hypothetical protein [Myxococcales bacterium]
MLRLAVMALALLGLAATPDPILQRDDDGTIDWTAAELRVLGVGTPRILSPNGAMTDGDPYEVAVADARQRLGRLLERIRVDADRRLGRIPELGERRSQALDGLRSPGPQRFSDGTVHLVASLDLTWLPEALGESPPLDALDTFVGPPLPDAIVLADPRLPTGLILVIDGPLSPSLRLQIDRGDDPLWVGLRGDAAGRTGLRWFREGDPAIAARVGPRPVRLQGAPLGVGRIRLSEGMDPSQLARVADLPAAVVLP